MLTYFTIFLIVVFIVLWNLILIVPMRENCVIERLGKFRAVLHPGIHFLIPFFDRVAYRHEIREQVIDIPSQSCISRDNTQIEVDGLVYMKVMDASKASYGIENYVRAGINLAQTTMRSEIGKLTLGEIFSERDELNETIVKEIDKASDPWGIKILRYEIKNIQPTQSVVHTLEKQMEAERRKRAEITLANAERDSIINISEGERKEAINMSEGAKQKRINEAEGQAQEISILADATAKGIDMMAEAINLPGGKLAVKMQLLGSFIEELGKILHGANVSVLPNEMANMKGVFEGFDQVAQNVNQASGASKARFSSGSKLSPNMSSNMSNLPSMTNPGGL